jgi:hypothetical protein
MAGDPEEVLIEEAVSAYRERDGSGRIQPSPAWWDLPVNAREKLFQRQLQSRALERALSADGMSATVRAVLNRIR